MLLDYKIPLNKVVDNIIASWRHLDPDKKKKELEELEKETYAENFWEDRKKAESILLKLKKLKDSFIPWETLFTEAQDTKELFEIAISEKDESLEKEIGESINNLESRYSDLRTLQLLSEEMDNASAFLTIHSGAGGTEACDWVSMLYRMYMRWAEKKGFTVEIIDILEAEGGLKSVTIQMDGEYVHGYLKGESGIHRLVRISPFDSNARRHTSFASVYIYPVIEDDIEIDIRPEDLRVDTYRASGAGGQHVNKTDSAVRLTHLETGIVVQCQTERSQHKNRANAMKMLKSKLYEHYKQKQEEENEKFSKEKKDIAWGSQIRSYVFQPYTMVKDHRTKHEIGNIQSVMDGNIDPFIEEYLKFAWKNKKE
ncbi:MAG: peptide chain release factor 2 [Spirochaetaceae bacterium]|nr:peptide chain release factor 2 [Spirochaetaceae bacterium]